MRSGHCPCLARSVGRRRDPGAGDRCAVRPQKQPRRITAPRRVLRSAAQTELCDQGLVALGILAMQVVEQAAAAIDHHQQATTAVVVLLVLLEVGLELLDACRQQGDLDFRRTGVVVAALVFFNDLAGVDGHVLPRLTRDLQKTPGAGNNDTGAPPGPPLAMESWPLFLTEKVAGIVSRARRPPQAPRSVPVYPSAGRLNRRLARNSPSSTSPRPHARPSAPYAATSCSPALPEASICTRTLCPCRNLAAEAGSTRTGGNPASPASSGSSTPASSASSRPASAS